MHRRGKCLWLLSAVLGFAACSADDPEGLDGFDGGLPARDATTNAGDAEVEDGENFPDATECTENCDLVTLSGRTVLRNAQVTVLTHAWLTTVDDTGRYTVEIPLADPNATITVVIDDFQRNVYLSVVGTAAELRAAAGDDLYLDETEDLDLNVSELSTARYLGLYTGNGGAYPNNAAELATAEDQINNDFTGTDLVDFAAALRLIRLRRPELLTNEVIDTSLLAERPDLCRALIDSLRTTNFAPSQLDGPREELLADTSFLDRAVANELSTHFDELARHRFGGARWDFDLFGNGSHQLRAPIPFLDPPEPFRWSVDNGFLRVDFQPDAPLPSRMITREAIKTFTDDPVLRGHIDSLLPFGRYRIPRSKADSEIRFIRRGEKTDWVSIHNRVTWHFDQVLPIYGVNMGAMTSTETSSTPMWRKEGSIEYQPGPDFAALQGVWAMRIVAPLDLEHLTPGVPFERPAFVTAYVDFDGAATATATFGETGATISLGWALTASGELLLSYPGGDTQSVRLWSKPNAGWWMMSRYTEVNGFSSTDYAPAVKIDPAFTFTEALLDNTGAEFWRSSVDPRRGFAFDADDRATSFPQPRPPLSWSLGQVVQIDQRTDRNHELRCDFVDPSCRLIERTTWEPVVLDGDRLWVIERVTGTRNPPDYSYYWDEMSNVWREVRGGFWDPTPVYVTPPRLLYYSRSARPR
jgi:hypothetical protein